MEQFASEVEASVIKFVHTYIHTYILFLLSNLNYKLDMPAGSIS